MNAVMTWVKSNVFIVVFVAVMVAALIAMPMFAGKMNETVRNDVEQRARKINDLNKIEKMDQSLPGQDASQTGVITDSFIEEYTIVAEKVKSDAESVFKSAIEHNRKNRTVVMEGVFPEIPAAQAEVLPKRFHESVVKAYELLLASVRAGTPPPADDLYRELERARTHFITQDLKKDPSEPLEEEEEKRLAEHLGSTRVAICAAAAEDNGIYLSIENLPIPEWNTTRLPSIGELFSWQWEYWVVEDILRAMNEANAEESSIIRAPVKRLISLSVTGLPEGTPSSTSGKERSGGSGGIGGLGGLGGLGGASTNKRTRSSGRVTGAVRGGPMNPKSPVPLDYQVSLTGRVTNPLYDVVEVELNVVVATSRLPEVLDALAQRNFITVIGLDLQSEDPFTAAVEGYIYGPDPVSNVTLRIETIWLRSWTTEFMPQSIKEALGIPIQSAGSQS